MKSYRTGYRAGLGLLAGLAVGAAGLMTTPAQAQNTATSRDVTYQRLESNQAGYWEASAVFPRFTVPNTLTQAANRIFGEVARAEYDAFRRQVADVDRPTTPWTFKMRPTISVVRDDLLSTYYTIEEYTGGAHGNVRYVAVNVGLKDGRAQRLTLDDLFRADRDGRSLSKNLVLESLRANPRAEFVGNGQVTDLNNDQLDRFVVTPSAISWLIQPGEVAPMATGPMVVKVPYKSFGDTWRPLGAVGATDTRPASGAVSATADIMTNLRTYGRFTNLIQALELTGLDRTLRGDGPFTLFAPSDAVFERLSAVARTNILSEGSRRQLTNTLRGHVVPGLITSALLRPEGTLTTAYGTELIVMREPDGNWAVDDSDIVTADIRSSNGVIHIINKLINPKVHTITNALLDEGRYGTFLAAVEAAGMENEINSGAYTVFAPVDEAFAAVRADGTLDALLEPAGLDQLRAILRNHLVRGRLDGDAAVAAGSADTLQGNTLTITKPGAAVTINGTVKVVDANVPVIRGAAHGIDTILLP